MKIEYIGMDVVNMDGDSVPAQVVRVDGNIRNAWLIVLAQEMGYTGQQLRMVEWIVNHIDDSNQLHMTQQEISDNSGVPIATVARAFKKLQGGTVPYIVSIRNGVYQINPDVMRGVDGGRMGIVLDFSPSSADSADEILKKAQELHEDDWQYLEEDEAIAEGVRLMLDAERIGGLELVAKLPWVVEYCESMPTRLADPMEYAKGLLESAHGYAEYHGWDVQV